MDCPEQLPGTTGFAPEGCTRGCSPEGRVAGCTEGSETLVETRLMDELGLSDVEEVDREKPVGWTFGNLRGEEGGPGTLVGQLSFQRAPSC